MSFIVNQNHPFRMKKTNHHFMKNNQLLKIILLLFLISFVEKSNAQFQKCFEMSVNPGFSTFSTNNEKGMSIAGEFSWVFNKWINPSVRLGTASGFKLVDKGMGTYQISLNSLAINANFNLLNICSGHLLQVGIGPCLNYEMYNYIFGIYFLEEQNRFVNELISEGYYCFAIDYFIRYRYKLSDRFQLGIEWSETGLFFSGKVKQSALSLTFTSVIF
jgi:hypothetical protein